MQFQVHNDMTPAFIEKKIEMLLGKSFAAFTTRSVASRVVLSPSITLESGMYVIVACCGGKYSETLFVYPFY